MLERFTAGAFQALNAAREEALRLEFAAVDTDHLLLGLAHEQRGLAARCLGSPPWSLSVRELRRAVERARGRGYAPVRAEEVVVGPSSLRVLGRAAALPGPIQPDGLFLALLEEREGAVAELWRSLGLKPEALQERALRLEPEAQAQGTGPLAGGFSRRVASEALQEALGAAEALARRHGHSLLGTEELLGGLLAIPGGTAARLLDRLGLAPERLHALAWRLIGQGSGGQGGWLAMSQATAAVLDEGWGLARGLGLRRCGTGHVLEALARCESGGAVTLLELLGVEPSYLLAELEALRQAHPDWVEAPEAWDGLAPLPEEEPWPRAEGEAWGA